jgi:hypothetical protein
VRSRRESVGAGILFWQQRGKSGGGKDWPGLYYRFYGLT